MSLHLDQVAAFTAISSESESATEVASDADPLEVSFEGIAALEVDSFDMNTPEQTPRHSKDPWTPVECASSPEKAPMLAPALSPLAAAAVLAATPGPTFLDG